MKQTIIRVMCVVLICTLIEALCSCGRERVDVYTAIIGVRERFSSELGAVTVYSSEAEEWEEAYIDQGFIAALLSDDGEYPAQMSGCAEYAFLISSRISVCEVWAVECRTYTYARAVYSLLETRKNHLTAPDYESEQDALAAAGAVLVRDGRYVYLAVCKNGSEIIEQLTDGC